MMFCIETVNYNDVEKLNDKFNDDLDRYQKRELPTGYLFNLGYPSAYLESAGFERIPIFMRTTLLAKKAGDKKHPFNPLELKDLVKHIQKPIAVFKYSKDNMRNLIIDTQSGGKHFLVGVTLNYNANGIEINSVSGLFPKESHEWIKWIQDGKALRIDQKEKVLSLIDSLRTNPADSARIGLNLDSATKIVKEFDNPTLYRSNIDENNVKEKSSSEIMAESGKSFVDSLGVTGNVEFVTDKANLSGKQADAKGFFDPKTGKVTVVVPNNTSVGDIQATILHELVGHYGLRRLFGDKFDDMMDDVFRGVDDATRKKIANAAISTYNGDIRVATEEIPIREFCSEK